MFRASEAKAKAEAKKKLKRTTSRVVRIKVIEDSIIVYISNFESLFYVVLSTSSCLYYFNHHRSSSHPLKYLLLNICSFRPLKKEREKYPKRVEFLYKQLQNSSSVILIVYTHKDIQLYTIFSLLYAKCRVQREH